MSKNDSYVNDARKILSSFEPTNVSSTALWNEGWRQVEMNEGRIAFTFAHRAEFVEFELPELLKA